MSFERDPYYSTQKPPPPSIVVVEDWAIRAYHNSLTNADKAGPLIALAIIELAKAIREKS